MRIVSSYETMKREISFKRIVPARLTFSKSVTVSVGVSTFGIILNLYSSIQVLKLMVRITTTSYDDGYITSYMTVFKVVQVDNC